MQIWISLKMYVNDCRLGPRQFHISSDHWELLEQFFDRNWSVPTSSLIGTGLSNQFFDRNWFVQPVLWEELICPYQFFDRNWSVRTSSLIGTGLSNQFFDRNWSVPTSSLIETGLSNQFFERNWSVPTSSFIGTGLSLPVLWQKLGEISYRSVTK